MPAGREDDSGGIELQGGGGERTGTACLRSECGGDFMMDNAQLVEMGCISALRSCRCLEGRKRMSLVVVVSDRVQV